jgi:hypothetical protein
MVAIFHGGFGTGVNRRDVEGKAHAVGIQQQASAFPGGANDTAIGLFGGLEGANNHGERAFEGTIG